MARSKGKDQEEGGAVITRGLDVAADRLEIAVAPWTPEADDVRLVEPDVPEVRRIPLKDLAESPRNRRHYNDTDLEELADSLRVTGQTTPIIVRPLGAAGSGPYEMAAGHRRFRAAKRAGLRSLLAVVREMDDATFLEVMTVENLQREDIHDLDQAELYAQMQIDLGWDVARIAKRVKKSRSYVYDSLALRTLAEPVRTLFFAERFSRAHAVELARLTSEQQLRAIDPDTRDGLWQMDRGADDDQEALDMDTSDDPYAFLKSRSIGEFKAWVRSEIRLAPDAPSLAIDFPAAHEALAEADVEAVPMVEITDVYKLTPAQIAGGSRVLTEGKWREAEEGSCEHVVRGFHSIGPRRGTVQFVCTKRKACRTHWGAEIRAAEAAAKQREQAEANGEQSLAPREDSWERQQRLQKEEMDRIRPAISAIEEAFLVVVKKASVKGSGPLAQLILGDAYVSPAAKKVMPVGTTADDLVRHLAWSRVHGVLGSQYQWATNLPRVGKVLGVDVKKLIAAAQPKPEPAAKAVTRTVSMNKPAPVLKPAKKSATKKAPAKKATTTKRAR
ncbi:MAG: ParB/RepB/Spo0J family partition protein [Gemmatimonadaceae bacterium]